jgi:hypothetical protein
MSFQGMKPILSYQITIGASSTAAANPISAGVKYIRLVATTACSVDISPTATASLTTSMALAANFPEYFACSGNHNEKVAVIGTTGTLTVTEMTY